MKVVNRSDLTKLVRKSRVRLWQECISLSVRSTPCFGFHSQPADSRIKAIGAKPLILNHISTKYIHLCFININIFADYELTSIGLCTVL